MNLPESPILAELFLTEAQHLMRIEDPGVDDIMKAAEQLAFAAAYAGQAPDVKLVGRILRARAKLAELLEVG